MILVYISSTSSTVVSKCEVASYPLEMKALSLWPLSFGSYTSVTSTNFSSTLPNSASPATVSLAHQHSDFDHYIGTPRLTADEGNDIALKGLALRFGKYEAAALVVMLLW